MKKLSTIVNIILLVTCYGLPHAITQTFVYSGIPLTQDDLNQLKELVYGTEPTGIRQYDHPFDPTILKIVSS